MSRLLVFLAISSLISGAAWIGTAAYDALLIAPGPDTAAASFTIEPGATVKTVAAGLEREGVIRGAFGFELFARVTRTAESFKAGTYQLRRPMSYASAIATLTVATRAQEVELTIPEGLTARRIGELVRAALPHVTAREWEIASEGLEGRLFPDTYRFRFDATVEDVVTKMQETLDRRLAENGVAKDDAFPRILILASIIEREVRSSEDMKLVADVFRKRLDIGMALQADSTVNYVTGGDDPSVSYEDLKIDSPYNTYKHPGLPPGPISNPGMNAILAAAQPEPNPYYYFLTTPEGEVKYARTFEEHQLNRARYLK
ncbi:hypothetical protein A2856_03200 [Candidatus Uhrbacteria bacterium RIFCSPHIGHO2_01_FULL_63_20]|uniref:Endolytic murein transglycosylase n=1 Tax=Candidatus Uhrbacteria bacterium RIFCSPHIGHO2_01_FULL_63_20 TaxID=1802385 RepID=A0A1F7TL80_9BACT|nr:MAG: hypothetical protein A2856_03200 [Candidatus Uhrbacteria bacterium RIFCSPHIGHO2_01_FULL_63_20]